MIKFAIVWVLTVTYSNTNTGMHQSYGAGYSYQLQYPSQAACLAASKSHETKVIKRQTLFGNDQVIRPHRQVRCDKAYIPVGVPK